MPFKIEQTFKYNSVNGLDSLPRIPLAQPLRPPLGLSDSARRVWRDSVMDARSAEARAAYQADLRAVLSALGAEGVPELAAKVYSKGIKEGAAILKGTDCDMLRRGDASPLANFFRFSFGPLAPESFDSDIAILRRALA